MPPKPKKSDPFKEYLKVQAKFDDQTRRILEQAARDIQARIARMPVGVGGQVRAAQLRLVLREITLILKKMWDVSIKDVIDQGTTEGMMTAQAALETLDRVMHAALPEDVAQALQDGLRLAAASGIRADATRRRRALSPRVWKQRNLSIGRVEDKIRKGLVQGLSAKELAKDVYEDVSPTAPGGASYAAMRLARTEINNAFHERQVEGAKRPGVTAVQWNLSGSHRVPDECNVYAAKGGNGHWPVDGVPDKPHPQCFCYLTYVTMEAGDFAKAFERGDFDDEIDRRTKAKLEKIQQGEAPPPSGTQRVEAALKSGIREEQVLTGGQIAETAVVTTNDGTRLVRKVTARRGQKWYADPVRQQDAEEMSSLILRALGLNAPALLRTKRKEVYMEFMEGRSAGELSYDEKLAFAKSDEGMILGLFDRITHNIDRHEGNWMISPEGRIIPIDHTHSWGFSDAFPVEDPDPHSGSIFWTEFATTKYDPQRGVYGIWVDNDISPEDLDTFKERLEGLREEFVRVNRVEWLEQSLQRIEEIRPYSKGKKRRIK